jgi:adenosylcobinamide kinase / adenosylcobinamide-phosphate guanylyltransferase
VSLTFLLGGARSGKSTLATELASSSGGRVTVIATGEARDDEMAARIASHRAERPAAWRTVEEPLELEAALAAVPAESTVIVDCLSLWVANLIERGDDDGDVEAFSERVADVARKRTPPTIVVSNEVGLGIVPASPLGRRYRDVLGRVNAQWAAVADEAALVVAGRKLRLQ